MAIGNDDFPGCAAHDRSAVGSRWSDRRRKLPDLREKVLLPTSKQGDIVIMDNFGSNKGKNPAGAEILTDLNPIEQVFAKLKHLPRKASARSVDALWTAIGQLLSAFTPTQCANDFESAG